MLIEFVAGAVLGRANADRSRVYHDIARLAPPVTVVHVGRSVLPVISLELKSADQ